MPNIEIYGRKLGKGKQVIDILIRKLFEGKPYQNDYVITVIDSGVWDHTYRDQPFIRLVTTPSDHHTEDIVQELQKLNADIEVMILNRFIPKKK